jgi:demethylmenaquinone methyltransferase/2-methoxy-6-polyprenyl-1,4-benzoquinol methylase
VDDEELLAEQVAFYRARAPRYDEWWQRRGAYARGPAVDLEFHRQVHQVEDALVGFAVEGDVLELAGGTGWWTERLARSADHLTVIDSSPEALELNRARVGDPQVEYQVADVFEWSPEMRYDVVFFSFWLSHVPRRRFAEFWSTVRSCLRPAGRVFLVDNHDDPEPHQNVRDPYVRRYQTDRHVRRLEDGREYHVVKVMYEPDELAGALADLDWTAELQATQWFLYGSARPGRAGGPMG